MGGEEALTEKRIGLFKELVPGLTRLGMIGKVKGSISEVEQVALRKVADHLGFAFALYPVETLDDLEVAFASALQDDVSAFYISGDPFLTTHLPRVMSLVVASGKPTVGVYEEWGRAGLLMSYSR